MKLKLIGKIDGLPLFEVSEGKYIAVDVEAGRHLEMWTWYGQLGRNFDSFEKCSNCDNEPVALELIETNKRTIEKALKDLQASVNTEMGQDVLKAQREFYDWLEPNRVYDYYNGGYEEKT